MLDKEKILKFLDTIKEDLHSKEGIALCEVLPELINRDLVVDEAELVKIVDFFHWGDDQPLRLDCEKIVLCRCRSFQEKFYVGDNSEIVKYYDNVISISTSDTYKHIGTITIREIGGIPSQITSYFR